MKQLQLILGKNFRTALLGYAGAIFTAALPVIQTGTFNIKKDWPYLVGAIGAALFGHVAKDASVTGLPNDPAAPNPKLVDAQAALAIAKQTNNTIAIEALTAFIDGLKKQQP